MRVCPKCGFSDNLLWRNCLYKRDLVYMHIDDFKQEYPLIWKQLETKRTIISGQFVYRKTKRYVLRKEPADMNQPFAENYELHDVKSPNRHFSDYGTRRKQELATQRKLLEVTT